MLFLVLALFAGALLLGTTAGTHIAKGLSDTFLMVGVVMFFGLIALYVAYGTLDGVRLVDDGSPFGRPVAEWWVIIPDRVIVAAAVTSLLLIGVGGGSMLRRSYSRSRLTI